MNKIPVRSLEPKTGLFMDGSTNYLQFPSLTIDEIEIDCTLDDQSTGSKILIDFRSGFNAYVTLYTSIVLSSTDLTLISGSIQKNIRQKIRVKSNTPFTDNVNVFANISGAGAVKGIIYNVTFYLKGVKVQSYDFTMENNTVSSLIIGKKNWRFKKALRMEVKK